MNILTAFLVLTLVQVKPSPDNIKDLVTSGRFFQGDMADRCGQVEAERLTKLLDSFDKPENAYKYVLALGEIGHTVALEALIQKLEQTSGNVKSDGHFRALTQIPDTIGLIAREQEVPDAQNRALQYLLQACRGGIWDNGGLQWFHERYKGDRLKAILLRQCIGALANTGTAAAGEALDTMRNGTDYVDIHDEHLDMVKHALDIYTFAVQKREGTFEASSRNRDSSVKREKAIQRESIPDKSVAELTKEARQAFEEARKLFFSADVRKISRSVADNGRPNSIEGAWKDAKFRKRARDVVAQQRAVLKAIPDGPVSLSYLDHEIAGSGYRVWLTFKGKPDLLEHEEFEKLMKAPTPKKPEYPLVLPDGRVVVTCIYHEGQWYWQPFGW